jgi:hypothetical protein
MREGKGREMGGTWGQREGEIRPNQILRKQKDNYLTN